MTFTVLMRVLPALALVACAESSNGPRVVLRAPPMSATRTWSATRAAVDSSGSDLPTPVCHALLDQLCTPAHTATGIAPAVLAQRARRCLREGDAEEVDSVRDALAHCALTDTDALRVALVRVMVDEGVLSPAAARQVPTHKEVVDAIEHAMEGVADLRTARVDGPTCTVRAGDRADAVTVRCEHVTPVECELDRGGVVEFEHGPRGWRWLRVTRGRRISGTQCEIM